MYLYIYLCNFLKVLKFLCLHSIKMIPKTTNYSIKTSRLQQERQNSASIVRKFLKREKTDEKKETESKMSA